MEGSGSWLGMIVNAEFTSVLLTHLKNLNFLKYIGRYMYLCNSPLRVAVVMCYVPLGYARSLLSMDEVSRQLYNSEDFPNDDRALTCFSDES